MPENKVRIRVAVAVNEHGNWAANGWKLKGDRGKQDEEFVNVALESLETGNCQVIHWVEAWVTVPLIPSETIEGEVKDA